MIDFKVLELSDREILQPFVSVRGRWISDTNFTNMFMWRYSRYAISEGQCVIQTRYPNENPFIFYPLGQGNKKPIIEALLKHYQALNLPLEIHSLQQSECDELVLDFPTSFVFEQVRDRFDYIDEVIAINNLWYGNANKDDKGLYFENLGINDALKHFDTLGLRGGLLRIDGEVAAFSFGENLDEDCALIHIEKANTIFNGAYQAINQSLLKNIFAATQYANREEDLGIEGLRKAKLSYQPAFLLEKYHARLKV